MPASPTSHDREPSRPRTLAEWRVRILDGLVRAVAVLAVLAYVPSIVASVRGDLWGVVVVDTAALLWAVALYAFRHQLTYRARAGGLLVLFFGLSVFLFVALGRVGAGPEWLIAAVVLGGLLLGARGAVLGLALATAILTALGIGLVVDVYHPQGVIDPAGWAATSGNLLFLAAVLTIPIALLLSALDAAAGVERDLRDRIEAQHGERLELEAHLEEARRMDALARLSRGIAHDLNNLLQPVLGYAELLRQDLPDGSPEQQEADDLVLSIRQAADLVHRMRDAIRGGGDRSERVDLAEVASLCTRTARQGFSSDITVHQDYASNAVVQGDPSALHQILMNLLINAGQAMPDGGELHVGIALEEGTVVLTVADTGVGMDTPTMDRAFEPFFTHGKATGTGLGLATVYSMVQSMDGEIEVDSSPGQGARFTVRFVAAERQQSEPRISGDRLDIVLADPHPISRRATRRVLEHLGHAVRVASTSAEALATLDERLPDVLVMEADLLDSDPVSDISRRHPALRVIVYAAIHDVAITRRASRLGASQVLVKPIPVEQWGRAIGG